MNQLESANPDRFFIGFLAGVCLVAENRLAGSRTALNRAFYKAIKSPAGQVFGIDASDVDYDPLYGVSPWFERQLTRAQRDLLVSFPNPSYATVDLKLNKEQAERVLSTIGRRAEYEALAREFYRNLFPQLQREQATT